MKLDELPESHTVKTLLDLMSRGNTHINTAAEVARAMQHDGLINEPLKAFTSCGASGACPQNTERDFHKWMRGAWGVELEPYYIKLNLEEPHLRLVEMSVFFGGKGFQTWFLQITSYPQGTSKSCQVDFSEVPVEVDTAVLLPHEVLHAISAGSRDKDCSLLLGTPRNETVDGRNPAPTAV